MRGENEVIGTAIVCVLDTDETEFTDNLAGVCHFCQAGVQVRPHAVTPRTLVCRVCFVERVEDGDLMAVTVETLREALLLAPEGTIQ